MRVYWTQRSLDGKNNCSFKKFYTIVKVTPTKVDDNLINFMDFILNFTIFKKTSDKFSSAI